MSERVSGFSECEFSEMSETSQPIRVGPPSGRPLQHKWCLALSAVFLGGLPTGTVTGGSGGSGWWVLIANKVPSAQFGSGEDTEDLTTQTRGK